MKRAGRIHAPELDALAAAAADGLLELRAPMPGLFAPAVAQGELVTAGGVIGELIVLGRSTALLAPHAAAGVPTATGLVVQAGGTGVRAVGYGDVLVALDPSLQLGGAALSPSEPALAASPVAGLVFRAPTSGRFYGRSSPDKPAFVEPGSQLTAGATVCLLEVMKTFHRVTYGGPGLPAAARVTRVLVADGADVNAGDPLLALE